MQKDTAYKVYSKQLLLLGNEYQDIFRDNMRTALMAHTKNLTSAILKETDQIDVDAPLPPLLTIIPDVYIKEDILTKIIRTRGHYIREDLLIKKMRTEEKRAGTLPYVVIHLQNSGSVSKHPENKINFLEQIFFFMYSGEFPSEDTTFQKIIIA